MGQPGEGIKDQPPTAGLPAWDDGDTARPQRRGTERRATEKSPHQPRGRSGGMGTDRTDNMNIPCTPSHDETPRRRSGTITKVRPTNGH